MKKRMSARTRNSSNTLVGGRGVTAIQLLPPRPPFSDFRWYQRLIARPVPRVIPGASRRHRQSTMLDSTAVVPTRTHRTMRARSPASTSVSRRLADLRAVRSGRLRGRGATSTQPDDARPANRPAGAASLPLRIRSATAGAIPSRPTVAFVERSERLAGTTRTLADGWPLIPLARPELRPGEDCVPRSPLLATGTLTSPASCCRSRPPE
jgi:hypothetical protein